MILSSDYLRHIFYLSTSITGLVISLIILIIYFKKPTYLTLFFLCFYLASTLHLAGIFILDYIKLNLPSSLNLQQLWKINLLISRGRYIFLLFFVNAVHKYKGTFTLNILLSLLLLTGAIIPFYIYTIVPEIVELITVFYLYFYRLSLYLLRNRLKLVPAVQNLVRNILFCSSFFLTGIVLDIIEDIPGLNAYFTILLLDFYPFYVLCLGIVFIIYGIKTVRQPVPAALNLTSNHNNLIPALNELIDRYRISRRECQIMKLMIGGHANSSITAQLFISESTVKKHINNLFRKLKIKSRWELLKLL